MECPDSTSIIAVNDLHISSGDIHYKQSNGNCSGLQTKMLKDVRNECINTGDCELDFLKTYVNEECAMVSPYVTVDFICVPSGMYVLMRNVQWCHPISQLIAHVSLHVCIC